MRIVHVAPTRGWYGTEAIASAMANELVGRGHQVGFVWREGPGFSTQLARAKLDPRVELCVLPRGVEAPDLRSAYVRGWLPWQPDVYHAHLGPGAELAAALAAGRTPWVASLHIRFFWSHFSQSDAVLAISPWQLSDIPPAYLGKRFLVNNFLPSEPKPPGGVPAALRKRLYASANTFVVGSVGRLHVEKGYDTLVKAFIAADLPDSRLVIVGEGPERARLASLAEGNPNICLYGYMDDASRSMSAFDLYASSSRAEAFGMTVLEAMSRGVPVISTTALGPTHILKDHPSRLIPIGDVDAMAAAIRAAHARRERRVEYDLTPYAASHAAQSLEGAYQETVASFVPRIVSPPPPPSRLQRGLSSFAQLRSWRRS